MTNVNPRPAESESGDVLPSYRAYLVRCWQERGSVPDEDDPIWRFSLDAPWYKDRRGFATLQALMDHLQFELTNQVASHGEQPALADTDNTAVS